jgi:hypothetical protein
LRYDGALTAPTFASSPTADPHVTLGIADEDAALRAGLEAAIVPDGVDALPAIAVTRRSRVARLVVDGRRLVIKRYVEPGLFLLRTFARASRARREAHALGLVAAALPGNPVRPVAWAERRVGGFVSTSWLVTTELVDAVNLRRFEDFVGAEREAVRAVVLGALPLRVAELHRAGVFARNLHAKNVLVQPATGALGLIDLPRASAEGTLSRRQRIYDLACLLKGLRRGLGADEQRRLLEAYGRAAGLEGDLTEAVAAQADLLDNRTPFAGAVHALRKRLKRTWLGQAAIGHRYDGESP